MSLRLTTDNTVLQHLAAFTLAWIAASSLFVYVLRPITVPPPKPSYHIPALGKGETAARNLLYLSASLRRGQAVVVLGSSELEQRYGGGTYSPELFFPAHHLAPVVTYGKPGFEALGMYGLLYALRPHLNKETRLVILLSPGWFSATNMQPAIFNDNFNDSILQQLYLSDDPREVFHDYLTDHQQDFTDMTPTQSLFLADPSNIIDWNFPRYFASLINTRAYAQREKLDLYLAALEQPQDSPLFGTVHTQDIPWDLYQKMALQQEKALETNNDLWLRNNFYQNIVMRYPEKFRNYFPENMNPEPEMNSLRLLLELLHRSKVNPLIVMLPVNNRVYGDLVRFNEIDVRITNLCREYGVQYVDMFDEPLRQGILRDTIHPGGLGWLKIDNAIAGHFAL